MSLEITDRAAASRLRYELSRLRSRRGVRLALLLSGPASPRSLLATARGRRVVPDFDVIAPASLVRRPVYPHLRVAYVGGVAPFASAAPHVRLSMPRDLTGADADLLVVDGATRWPTRALEVVAAQARRLELPRLVLCRTPEQLDLARVLGADVVAASAAVLAGAPARPAAEAVELEPWVDASLDNPVGWEPQTLGSVFVRAADPGVEPGAGSGPARDAARARVLRALATRRPVVVDDPSWLPADLAACVLSNADLAGAGAGGFAGAAGATGATGAGTLAGSATERRAVAGSRLVLTAHESLARFERLLEALDVPRRPAPRVSVLLCTRRPAYLEKAVDQVAAQRHPDVELVLVLHGPGFEAYDVERAVKRLVGPVRVVRAPAEATLGDALNRGLDAVTGEYVAKMDDDDLYGSRHLEDLLLTLRYSGADLVGKWANEVYLADRDRTVVQDLDRQERWAHHLPGATLLLPTDVLRGLRFRRVPRAVDTHLVRALHAAGGVAYSTHRFGFVRVRGERPGDPDGPGPGGLGGHGGHTSVRRAVATEHARTGLDRSVLEV